MALYEYVCRDCDVSFELRRPMTEADDEVTCPDGHGNVRRKLSLFASVGASAGAPGPQSGPSPSGGCCGGGCGCR